MSGLGSIPTDYRTETNKYEVQCSKCGKQFFIDEQALEDLEHRIANESEELFTCIDCREADLYDLEHR